MAVALRLEFSGQDHPVGNQIEDEFAAEMSNKTCHAVMHLTWVPDGSGGHRGQMAVLVKPNGRLGRLYMAAILPFRHVLVYPPLLKGIAQKWEAQANNFSPSRNRRLDPGKY